MINPVIALEQNVAADRTNLFLYPSSRPNTNIFLKKEFTGKILLIEDGILHNALIQNQLCAGMGFPKESITLATDGN